MIDLDDPGALRAADPSDALGALERIDQQWVEAARRARGADSLPTRHGITGVVHCGMGGSGVAGDVLAAVAFGRGHAPVTVVKGFQIPAWTGPNTLVIVSSYSGNTAETLACLDQALAAKARVVAVTTGGALGEAARAHGVCVISPVEGLQPRQAFVSLMIPVLVAAERLQIVRDLTEEFAESEGVIVDRTKMFGPDTPTSENEAKRVARALLGRIPLIWGQEGILEVAANRWRTELNENAKVPAFSSVVPELDHNEIEGYSPGVPGVGEIAIVALRGPDEHPGIAARLEASAELAGERVAAILEARAVGSSPLPRLMSSVLLAGYVSVYLALLRGVDPTPVPVLEGLKRRMTEEGAS